MFGFNKKQVTVTFKFDDFEKNCRAALEQHFASKHLNDVAGPFEIRIELPKEHPEYDLFTEKVNEDVLFEASKLIRVSTGATLRDILNESVFYLTLQELKKGDVGTGKISIHQGEEPQSHRLEVWCKKDGHWELIEWHPLAATKEAIKS